MPVRGMEDCTGYTYWAADTSGILGEGYYVGDLAAGGVDVEAVTTAGDATIDQATTPESTHDDTHMVTIIDGEGITRQAVGHEVICNTDGTIEVDGHEVHIPELHAPWNEGTIAASVAYTFRGYCQNEWCLPTDAAPGDMYETRDSHHRWVWTGAQWQQVDSDDDDDPDTEEAPVLREGREIYVGNPYVPGTGIYGRNEITADTEAGTTRGLRARTILFEDLPEINPDEMVVPPHFNTNAPTVEHINEMYRAVQEGRRFHFPRAGTFGIEMPTQDDGVLERFLHMAERVDQVDKDNTTDTTQEQFVDIFEVAT